VSEEIAREAFRLAAAKLPVLTTFVSRTALWWKWMNSEKRTNLN
jgi:ribosomal protein L16/L10AE